MNPQLNQPGDTNTESHIRLATLLIALGLAIQIISLLILHPLAFVGFLAIGCPLVAAGIFIYLKSLV